MRKTINHKVIWISIGSGIVAFLLGELFLNKTENVLPDIVRFGIYISMFMFVLHVSMFVFSHELMNHSSSVNAKCIKAGILLVSIVCYFLLSAFLQFIYGLDLNDHTYERVENYCFLIDNSGSTEETDPNRERFKAISDILQNMNQKNQVSVILFSDTPIVLAENEPVTDDLRQRLAGAFSLCTSDGGTDIEVALTKALQITSGSTEKTAAVLLSDGESYVHCNRILKQFNDVGTRIDAVAFSNMEAHGTKILQRLTGGTGGMLYSVEDVSQVKGALEKVMTIENKRFLLGIDPTEGGVLVSFIRVISFILLGFAECISLGLFFDNRYVFAELRIPCLVTGLLAGLCQECICKYYYSEVGARWSMCMFLALLLLKLRKTAQYCGAVYDETSKMNMQSATLDELIADAETEQEYALEKETRKKKLMATYLKRG